jgi:hypothetical protein
MLENLLTAFRSVADAVIDTPAGEAAAGDVAALEAIKAEREQAAAAAAQAAEARAASWLATRLHGPVQG